MVFYHQNILEELTSLPHNDRERIVQALHWAISEKQSKAVIQLPNFREGEELRISSYEYSELYNALTRS